MNSAGCGAHLRELTHLFEHDTPEHAAAERLSARVRDLSEVLVEHKDELPRAQPGGEKLAWDDPCHLCHAQCIRSQPREVLDALGSERVELRESESCCGSAGIYSLLRPAASQEVFSRRLAAFSDAGADVLVTGNPGCHLQWHSGLSAAGAKGEVRHLAEVVDAALEAAESPEVAARIGAAESTGAAETNGR